MERWCTAIDNSCPIFYNSQSLNFLKQSSVFGLQPILNQKSMGLSQGTLLLCLSIDACQWVQKENDQVLEQQNQLNTFAGWKRQI